jgi:hypothetical protein
MLSGEATHINFIVFGLTRLGLEPTIYRTRGEHANHYFSVLYINDGPFSFGHCIACSQVAIGDLQIIALFLKQ